MDLAGLSLLLLHLNHTNGLKPEFSEISLNNNLYHVIILKEMPDVVEVWNITVCLITLPMESVPNHLTHIPLEMVKLLLVHNHLVPKTLSIIQHTN